MTILSAALMDRAGRRNLLCFGGFLMGLGSIFLFFSVMLPQEDQDSPILFSLIGVSFYIIGFSIGWGAIPMLLMSEILPLKYRHQGTSFIILVNWLGSFIVTSTFNYVYQNGKNSLAPIEYLIFLVFSIISIAFVIKYLPETGLKNLEEIEEMFIKADESQ